MRADRPGSLVTAGPGSSTARRRSLIARVARLCAEDPGVEAALMYGSFADPGPAADEHSDIEFWLFFAGPLPDPVAWITAVEPPLPVTRNESGAELDRALGPPPAG